MSLVSDIVLDGLISGKENMSY